MKNKLSQMILNLIRNYNSNYIFSLKKKKQPISRYSEKCFKAGNQNIIEMDVVLNTKFEYEK